MEETCKHKWDVLNCIKKGTPFVLAPMESLYLFGNPIGHEGAKALANAIQFNRELKILNIYETGIGNEGAKALATALAQNTTLTLLDISWNNISDEGACAVAKAIKRNSKLTVLDLSWNTITDEGAKVIAKALRKNPTLVKLELRVNKISDGLMQTINKLTIRNEVRANKQQWPKYLKTIDGSCIDEIMELYLCRKYAKSSFQNLPQEVVSKIAGWIVHIWYQMNT